MLAARAYRQGFNVLMMQAPEGADFNDFLPFERNILWTTKIKLI
ncbi:hypothetical protein [Bartonella machadoae]